ncbi:MAG: hypothetical protein ABIT01_13520, partial [Thermoanaerobaculia bacterium]
QGQPGFGGDGGLATAAALNFPSGVVADGTGIVYVADTENNRVRRILPSGQIDTVAGIGTRGFIGDGDVATSASLAFPSSITTTEAGDLVIADSFNHRIRVVDAATHRISTRAGSASAGFAGDDGPATLAQLRYPAAVVIDGAGNLLIADTDNNRIRKVAATTGIITTLAGTGASGYSGDGGTAAAATLRRPQSLAVDPAGNVLVADTDNHVIRRISATTGLIATIAGSGTAGFDGDGGPATTKRLNQPRGIALASSGALLIADTGNQRVRLVATSGTISTVAGNGVSSDVGDGGPAVDASLASPSGILVDTQGNLFIADAANARVRRVDASTGVIRTVAGGRSGFSGDYGRATEAGLTDPTGVHVDSAGNLFIADSKNNRIRAVMACVTVSAPALSTPADSALNLTLPSTLTWAAVPGAFRYDVRLDTISPPLRIVATDLADLRFGLSNLLPGTRYYWRVTAKGDPFCEPVSSSESLVRSFVTDAGCGAPSSFNALLPADLEPASGSSPLLSWQPASGASRYDLYLGSSNPPALLAAGLTGTTYPAQGLAPGSSYSWFVIAHASCDPALTTSTPQRSFKVSGACAGAGALALVFPPNGSTGVTADATLSWSASASASGYDLYFGTATAPPLYQSDLSATSILLAGLAPGATYSWRVVAKSACDPARSATTPISSFTVAGTCSVPQPPAFAFVPPGGVGIGQTYVVAWREAAGLDAGGRYVVERSLVPAFATLLDAQETTGTSASFISTVEGVCYHRVRAVPGCDPAKVSANSDTRTVAIVAGTPSVVFTVQPRAVITSLGERLEDQKTSIAIENLGKVPVLVNIARQELNSSVPFFNLVDPLGGDLAFVSLQPRAPRTFDVRFSGPPADRKADYEGIIVVSAVGPGLAITPYAFVNLKVGGVESATPVVSFKGSPSEYAFFPGFSGPDDANREPITIEISNTGSTPMELGAEIGPEVWLVPETSWNAAAIQPGSTRTIRLFTQRARSLHGSAFPRFTYLTLRNRNGRTARVLVQDNDVLVTMGGRPASLDAGIRSYVIPSVVNGKSRIDNRFVSKLRLSNAGSDAVAVDLFFTPSGADGFDASQVKRARVLVPGNDLVTLSNPVVQLFGLTLDGAGSLEVRAAVEKAGLLTVSSSVDAPARGGGTFGFQMPSVIRGEGARIGRPHVLAGITAGVQLRSNLILAETTGIDSASIRAVLYGSDGDRLGDRLVVVPRYGQIQLSGVIQALGGGESLDAGHILLIAEAGGGSVVGVVTVIDNTNDDAATFVSRVVASVPSPLSHGNAFPRPSWARSGSATLKSVIPAIVNGFQTFLGSESPFTFRSELTFVSVTTSTTDFRLTYADAESGRTHVTTVSVPGRQTKKYSNILEQLFEIPPGQKSQGPLFVESQPTGAVTCKVYSLLETGTLGDAFPVIALPFESLTGAGTARPIYTDGLEQSVDPMRGTRSNLILNEVLGQPATVIVRLYEAGNRVQPIAEKSVALGALEKVQLSTVFSGLGLDTADRRKDRTNVQCVVVATAGAGLVSGVITTIDNSTGDIRNSLLTPSGGVPATGGFVTGF